MYSSYCYCAHHYVYSLPFHVIQERLEGVVVPSLLYLVCLAAIYTGYPFLQIVLYWVASRAFTAPLLLSISCLCVSLPLASIVLLHFKAMAIEPYFKQLYSNNQSLTRDFQLHYLGWEAYYYCALFPSILESYFMSLFIMDLADSVNIYTWDNSLGGHTDFLDYFPIFHCLSIFNIYYQRHSWYLNQVVLLEYLISCNFPLVKGFILYILVHYYYLYISALQLPYYVCPLNCWLHYYQQLQWGLSLGLLEAYSNSYALGQGKYT